jgi:membrane protein
MLNIAAWVRGCKREIWALIKDAVNGWSEHHGSRIGAALAFYTVFSLGPILLLAVAVAGFFFGQGSARDEIHQQMINVIGPQAAAQVQMVLVHAHRPTAGVIATAISLVTLLLGADTALVELKSGLDEIWGVPSESRRWYWAYLRTRLLSVALIFALGLLLLASLLLSAAVGALEALSRGIIVVGVILHLTNSIISFGLAALLFATVYKVLPSLRLAWKDVAVGALITAVLFIIGKYAIGLWGGRLRDRGAAVGVLLCASVPVRGGAHARIRLPVRVAARKAATGRRGGSVGVRPATCACRTSLFGHALKAAPQAAESSNGHDRLADGWSSRWRWRHCAGGRPVSAFTARGYPGAPMRARHRAGNCDRRLHNRPHGAKVTDR